MRSNHYDHINITDTAYVYDIKQDKWELETRTPLPIIGARTLVVGNDIYFFDLSYDIYVVYLDLWKYDTITKEWTVLTDELPFIWMGELVACENNGIIYFTGSIQGYHRNIIHRYDTKTKEWKSSLFLNKKLKINMFACYPDSIQIGGKLISITEEIKKKKSKYWMKTERPTKKRIEFFTVSYEDGNTEFSDFSITGSFLNHGTYSIKSDHFASKSGWQYLIDVQVKNSKLIKVNPVTKHVVDLGTFDFTLENTFMSVYEDKEVYLLGGNKQTRSYYEDENEDEDEEEDDIASKIKTFNHKIKIVDTEVNQQDVDSSKQTVIAA